MGIAFKNFGSQSRVALGRPRMFVVAMLAIATITGFARHVIATANQVERRQFLAISKLFDKSPWLLKKIFDPDHPKLRSTPELILKNSIGLCSSEFILIQLALDFWCDGGELKIGRIFELDSDLFSNVLESFKILGPKMLSGNFESFLRSLKTSDLEKLG